MTNASINYTAEQTAYILSQYTADNSKDTIERLAKELCKTPKSIIAKLSRSKDADGNTVTTKAVNYTEEQTAYMLGEYLADKSQETIDRLAVEMGKSTRSIIAKLHRTKGADGESVYVKKAYVAKDGKPSVKKDQHADAIAKVLRLTEHDADSLTKCNKAALAAIWAALANSVPATPENTAS
jgi:uncharacterized protein YutE (UPF0331/DUF86 family)